MKHTQKVLIIFISLFFITQILGLYAMTLTTTKTIQIDEELQDEKQVLTFEDTTLGERPKIQGIQTIISITLGVIIGTIILLTLSRYNKVKIWKHWFFIATTLTISITLGALLKNFTIAWIVAIILGIYKVYKPNIIIHNITEILIYPGIAILIAPLLNITYAIILLILISIYDAYAVWKSKHMIKLAQFTKNTNLFPGLALNYDDKGKIILHTQTTKEPTKETKNKTRTNIKKQKIKTGILGGGDLAFPLIFATTILLHLLEQGQNTLAALSYTSIIVITTTIALTLLFIYGKPDKYYPAMPYATLGCLIGYAIIILII